MDVGIVKITSNLKSLIMQNRKRIWSAGAAAQMQKNHFLSVFIRFSCHKAVAGTVLEP
jgi:hypothetical protein